LYVDSVLGVERQNAELGHDCEHNEVNDVDGIRRLAHEISDGIAKVEVLPEELQRSKHHHHACNASNDRQWQDYFYYVY
jgi:hypothetical protein